MVLATPLEKLPAFMAACTSDSPRSTAKRSASRWPTRLHKISSSRPTERAGCNGDGAFGFNAMEIATAARHKAPVLIVVANNGSWAIEVRDQQETHGKVVGTRLQFADHAAMARAFGLHGERIEREADLAGAIQRALQNLPAVLDVLVTPEPASSDAKSGLAWVPDLQALEA